MMGLTHEVTSSPLPSGTHLVPEISEPTEENAKMEFCAKYIYACVYFVYSLLISTVAHICIC